MFYLERLIHYFCGMFLRQMKYILLFSFFALSLSSCGEYQRVLNGDDVGKKFVMSDSLYKAGKYMKAVTMMEQIVPAYRGKPQAQKLMYLYADSYYQLGDFYLSGYQFERFTVSYPKSDSVEVAAYKSARSYYELSPRYSLDQKETYTALEKVQAYINKYPSSPKRAEANKMTAELRQKLDRKAFETAKQFQRISDFKAAIGAYDNFITNHPGSIYRKEAFFRKLEAEYTLAINSFPSLVQERLLIADEYYTDFAKYFAEDEEYGKDALEIKEDIDKRLESYQKEI